MARENPKSLLSTLGMPLRVENHPAACMQPDSTGGETPEYSSGFMVWSSQQVGGGAAAVPIAPIGN